MLGIAATWRAHLDQIAKGHVAMNPAKVCSFGVVMQVGNSPLLRFACLPFSKTVSQWPLI